MNKKFATVALLSAALAAAPLSSAQAYGWHHGYGGGWGYHRGPGFGLIAGVAAITGAAVAVATLPFRAVAEVAEPAPQPVYAAPQPVYYQPQSVNYQPQPVYVQRPVVYSYPAPAYYGY